MGREFRPELSRFFGEPGFGNMTWCHESFSRASCWGSTYRLSEEALDEVLVMAHGSFLSVEVGFVSSVQVSLRVVVSFVLKNIHNRFLNL